MYCCTWFGFLMIFSFYLELQLQGAANPLGQLCSGRVGDTATKASEGVVFELALAPLRLVSCARMSDWQLKTHCMYLRLAVETPEGTASVVGIKM